MIEILAVLLAFASVFLIVISMSTRPVDPVAVRLRSVQAGIRSRDAALSQPFILRAAAPVAGGVLRLIINLLPTSWVAATRQKLTWAGSFMSLPGFVALWVIVTLCLGVFAFIMANSFGASTLVLGIAIAASVVVGALLPQIWLQARVSERQYQARKALPDALDLLTTSVEAGLSLDAAMVRVAEYQRGPFQDELATAMQDVTLGKSRPEALMDLTERLNVPEVTTFVQTMNQAEISGAPIAQVLRAQAQTVRVRRRQAAEAQAQRAPLLMLFPTIFLIMPSVFIVLLAPAALTVVDILTNGSAFDF
jgi:tight adherence protein C